MNEKHKIAILEQKYQFHLTHCKSKVVRYENMNLSILGSLLYNNFPERYGYLMLKNELKKHEIAILEQKYQFHLTHWRSKVVRYEITKLMTLEWSLYYDFSPSYGSFRVFDLRNPKYTLYSHYRKNLLWS